MHETDSNYTGTPATDMIPIFPSSSSPIIFEDNSNSMEYSASHKVYDNSSDFVDTSHVTSEYSDQLASKTEISDQSVKTCENNNHSFLQNNDYNYDNNNVGILQSDFSSQLASNRTIR